MKDFEKIVAVVPSLSPDEKLPQVVEGLLKVGFRRIVVINDGSSEEYDGRFAECAAHPEVTLLRHEVNRGKGAAMKTAFAYILENMKDSAGAITVDGDNQHHPEDCRNCAEAMLRDDKVVLGVRDFSLPDVPRRSRMGNRITCGVFRLFCGMKLTDTQTGLRAFPMDVLPKMVETKGDRYEYETQMLLDFKTYRIPYEEVTIRTVYIEENQTSHFRVFRDSFRIYKIIFAHFIKYSAASIISYFIEWGIMALTLLILNKSTELSVPWKTAIAFLCARAISSVFNFFVNHKIVFKAKCSMKQSLAKYYMLCIPLAAIGLTLNLLGVLGISAWGFLGENAENYIQLWVHPIVQILLFIVTYSVQREWVYKTDKAHQFKRKTKKRQ